MDVYTIHVFGSRLCNRNAVRCWEVLGKLAGADPVDATGAFFLTFAGPKESTKYNPNTCTPQIHMIQSDP